MIYPRISSLILVPIFWVLSLSSSLAHEFWIEPLSYKVALGENIQANLKNGQDFKGTTYSYVNEIFTRFEMVNKAGTEPVKGRRGDRPALNVVTKQKGLHVPVYASTMQWVRYNKYEKFEAFIRSKKMDWVLAVHEERGFPTEKIMETYYRYAKSLIAVGTGAGQDRFLGQPIEIVALTNPFTSDLSNGVDVQVFLGGEPYAQTDVQIYHYVEGSTDAVEDRVTTDSQGRVTIPAFEGGPFLINAMHIRDPRPEGIKKGSHWESIWATLTYELPAD